MKDSVVNLWKKLDLKLDSVVVEVKFTAQVYLT